MEGVLAKLTWKSLRSCPEKLVVMSLVMYFLCTAVPAKRRKGRPVATEEEEAALDGGWTPRANTDLKITSIYNRSATEAPAEVTVLV